MADFLMSIKNQCTEFLFTGSVLKGPVFFLKEGRREKIVFMGFKTDCVQILTFCCKKLNFIKNLQNLIDLNKNRDL